jgi:acetyl-CoA decarbonylase/synthase complex subunit delta
MDRIIIDPTTGGLGYGLEYTYSVMERLRMAAMAQGDDKLQFPMINNLGNEVWKCKEAKLSADEEPTLGDPEKRGILMEAVGAVSYLMAGSDILIMRHPESIRMVKSYIDLLVDGGSAENLAPISKQLDDVDIDYAGLAPEPDLTIAEEAKKAAPAKKAADKPKKAAPAKKAAAAKTEADAKAKAEAEAKAKAEAEAKAKAEADAKAKAEADAKKQAEADARAKREAEEDALRQKRAAEREKLAAERSSDEGADVPMTAAATQKSENDKILEKLNWVHRRVNLY